MPSPTIAPCIWFDDQAEDAASLYTDLIPDSRVRGTLRYPVGMANPADKPPGSVLTVEFELAGTSFTALNGGAQFVPNQTISFFVHTEDAAEVDRLVSGLVDGGRFLMPLDEYPWSPRYAWVQDRYGVSWQVVQATEPPGGQVVMPCLMFTGDVHGNAEEALERYVSLFPASQLGALHRHSGDAGPAGTLMHGHASLARQQFFAMDSDQEHGVTFSEGVSLQVLCDDQAEIDHYWSGLGADGEFGPCGWLKDAYGVSWQVVPRSFVEMALSRDAADPGYRRAFEAMLEIGRLDVAVLEDAFDRT